MNFETYDLPELRRHLPEYVNTITEKRKYKKYNCPLCNSGKRENGTPAFNLYADDLKCHCHSCGFDGDIISLYLAENNMANTPSNVGVAIRTLAGMYNLIPITGTAPASKPKRTKTEKTRIGSRAHFYTDKSGTILARKTITKYSDGSKSPFWSLYHPDTHTFSNGLKGLQMPLYHADKIHNSKGTVYFVEGEKDVETMENCYGFTATSTPNGGGQTSWIDLYNEDLPGRDIIVITDNDPSGENYGKTVSRNLCKIAKSIKIVPAKSIWSDCPEKGDITDIIEALGSEKTAQLLSNAVQKAEFYHPEPETQETFTTRDDLPCWIRETDKGLRVSAELLAKYIYDTENYIFVQLQDQEAQRCYWYQNGVYTRISSKHLKAKIRSIINGYDITLAKVRAIEDTYTHITYPDGKHFVSDEALLDADENIINFQNGMLHLDTMELKPHSPDYLCTIQIPCNWNPDATKNNTFYNYIMHLANDDWYSAETLIQAIGLAISNVKIERFKKSLILCGAGNSGKSVFLKFMSMLIGKSNFAAMPFEKLDKRFSIATLYRKRLAGDDDCNYCNFSSVSVFKSMTGGGELMCEEKGKPSFPFVFNGLYVICANSLPLFGGDKGTHVYERIIPIKCGSTVPEKQRDKKILEKLYAEREAIVFLAIMELKKAIEDNYTLSMSTESKALLEQYKIENDVVLQFLDECCVPRKSYDSITIARLYEAFKRWCFNNSERYTPRKREFRESICNFYGVEPTPEGHAKIETKVNGNRYYKHTLTLEAKQELGMLDSVADPNISGSNNP